MKARPRPRDTAAWLKPSAPDDPKDPGYDAYVRERIAAGMADVEAGRVIPDDEFWAQWERDHPDA